jgi:hypothetical protein
MNKRSIIAACIAAIIVAGSLAIAAQPAKPAAGSDPRLDKVIEQNEQILKNQAEIMKMLQEVQTGLNALRRRSS